MRRERKAVELKLDALEENPLHKFGVLLGVDDVAAVVGNEAGYRRDNPGLIGAREEEHAACPTGDPRGRARHHGHTSRAVSTTLANFAHCWSLVRWLPAEFEANPHCGLRASRSIG